MIVPYRLLEERPPGLYLEKVRAQGGLYAPLASIPQAALEILVAREDPGFYAHNGVLPKSMIRALKRAVRSGRRMVGASTITQQLVKNLYLSPERSVLRKGREAALALRVEKTRLLTKDEILELYFNCVEYGPDVYGIADAAAYYFGKTPDALTRNQAVFLATMTPAPYRLCPLEDPYAFAKERNASLYVLVALGAMGLQEAKDLAHEHLPRLGLDPELRQFRDIYGVPDHSKTAEGLVRYARVQLGAPYWHGAYGQVATIGLLNHSRWKQPDAFEGTEFLDDFGNRVFDDAGLVKGYRWSSGPDARPRYDELYDWSSAELYALAQTKGDISSFDYENGRLLFSGATPETIDHVGVYSSEGCVYHAKDRAHGVVREPFCENAWTFWSELPAYAGNSNLASYTAPSPNHSGQRTHPITKITPHYMVGNLPIEICGGLFADEEYGASSNYGIGSDGRIALYVDERCRSWASASPWNDQRAVTIECANLADGSLSDACWSALVDLCADICIRNGIEDCSYTGDKDGVLTMHCMFADTECPGPWLFGQFGRLSREVNARLMRCAGR